MFLSGRKGGIFSLFLFHSEWRRWQLIKMYVKSQKKKYFYVLITIRIRPLPRIIDVIKRSLNGANNVPLVLKKDETFIRDCSGGVDKLSV